MEAIKYILVPSLEHIALVKTATVLWNQEDIRYSIEKLYFNRCRKWQRIEEKVMEKVSLLPQPEPLKEKISGVIKPVGLEIYAWIKKYNSGNWSPAVFLPVEFGWTPQGTLDRRKTAETLIRNETIDITESYKLACIYCLKNAIEALWEKMPEDHKESVYCEEKDLCHFDQRNLVIVWTCDINGKLDRIEIPGPIRSHWRECTAYQYAYTIAKFHNNIEAAQYFLSMQTPVERKESLSIRRWNMGCNLLEEFDVFRTLFLLMNEKQQQMVIEKNAPRLLLSFLNWPRQSLFMEMANCLGHFLDSWEYYHLFENIINKTIDGFKDYDYQNLFEKFWMQSPMTHKKYVINKGATNSVLLKLVKLHDKKNISVILKDATVEEKEDIIFNRLGISICKRLTYIDGVDFARFFISECISTQEKMIKFKEKCEDKIYWSHVKNEREARGKFFQCLDDLILKGDKRRDTEDKNSTPAKKLCSS